MNILMIVKSLDIGEDAQKAIKQVYAASDGLKNAVAITLSRDVLTEIENCQRVLNAVNVLLNHTTFAPLEWRLFPIGASFGVLGLCLAPKDDENLSVLIENLNGAKAVTSSEVTVTLTKQI